MVNEKFVYSFTFQDGRTRMYTVELDPNSGRLMSTSERANHPAWTDLEFHKCSHCPLKSSEHPQCPVAKNLDTLTHEFKEEKSHVKVAVKVESEQRTYLKELPLQDGLYGLFGLLMATSDCPYFSFLRPMARFHLPFSTLDETLVRSASFYLFKQYFLSLKGRKGDFALNDFAKLYENVSIVNQGIIARIRAVAKADADANSIVILDSFASLLGMQTGHKFDDLEKLFS